ncbi:MAG: diguanylate cyclase [Bellilinea sp.]|nr:MAG: diguanylate cyclase [Bellilinea sp.]
MEDEKATLLIVEDDVDVAEMLSAYFQSQGYEVHAVHWGEDGLRAAHSTLPDLIILDIRLPDIDGFEVARQLREHRKTRDIPILFLTERRERSDRLRGLQMNAEDYITKPFDIQELRLRVRNTLRRARQGSLTNPVTGLPEGGLVDEHLQGWLDDPTAALFVVSILNLDHFREVYGFVASDDLLRALGLMLHDLTREMSRAEFFIGHLNPTDFLVIARLESRAAFAERAQKRLEQSFDYFYRDQDRERGLFRQHGLGVRIREWQPQPGSSLRTPAQVRASLLQLTQSPPP